MVVHLTTNYALNFLKVIVFQRSINNIENIMNIILLLTADYYNFVMYFN